MPRLWTLAEARAALPAVIRLLEEARTLLRDEAEARTRHAAAAAPASISPAVNGHGAARPDEGLARAARLLQQVTDMGVQIKDIEQGLIDFPYLRGQEEVLLCYRLGEPDIAFWHDLEHGFAGRRPLSEL